MRYWVYINDKVEGPYEEDKLVTLQGFTPDTLICSEEIAAGGTQEWVKASSIFEFDQVEKTINQPLPASEVFKTQTAHNEPLPAQAAGADNVTGLLLEKIDLLTREISGLQAKLDDMQTKLDTAIASAQNARTATQPLPAYEPPQDDARNTITLTRQDIDPVNEEALITNTESLVSQAEDIVAAANQEKPLDMLGPVDLGDKKDGADSAQTEVSLGSKAEEEVVLRSALDSLYNAKVQTQEEKESTFQDLLTPKQAQELAAQAAALKAAEPAKPTLDDALKSAEAENPAEVSTPSVDEAAKDALLSELTAEPKEDVLDQVIKEKEEEKKADTFNIAAAAAAGAAAGAAAVAGLNALSGQEEKKEDAPGFETVAEAAAEPLPEKQTLDFTSAQQEPALSIAPDRAQPEQVEEVKPAAEMPADQPVQPEPQAAPAAGPQLADLPSIDDQAAKPQTLEQAEEKDETLQELVPGAKAEKPEGVIITDADLNEAFAERDTQESQSVEQLFGVAPEQKAAEPAAADTPEPALPQFSDQTADKPLPVGNPNDLTEIELKEGSTYLISDFVPPAQTDGNALPKELSGLQSASANPDDALNQPLDEASQTSDVQEMVASTKQTEKPVEPATDAPKDVTVSQVILENTIKTKRGATLDIKTVPMVPEPAQSDRLHLDDLDDDINTQHDMKSADVKTSGGMTKAIIGTLVAVVLAAVIYVMLAFMNLIPPQFNLLSSKQDAAQTAEQNAQMEEMLGGQTAQQPVYNEPSPAANPMDATLAEVKNFPLMNGYTLQEFIEAKHPAAKDLITWDISTAVDPDNYSILVKVPPENPQSFKISYRFNYNTVTKALDPTISDAKNLLDSVSQGGMMPQQPSAAATQTGQEQGVLTVPPQNMPQQTGTVNR